MTIQNEASTPALPSKLARPKSFQTPKNIKSVQCPGAKDADPSCEIKFRKEKDVPKTKYLTIIEMKCNP